VDPLVEVIQILKENQVPHRWYFPIFKRDDKSMLFVTPKNEIEFKRFYLHAHGQDVWLFNSELWSSEGADAIQTWIVPGVCFTQDGNRIGFGAGFYDSHLALNEGLYIGIAYDCQISPIPFQPEPYDIPMDIVITEQHTHIRDTQQLTFPIISFENS
jgi:5,10-methenyltetrahydrofolate synthetase